VSESVDHLRLCVRSVVVVAMSLSVEGSPQVGVVQKVVVIDESYYVDARDILILDYCFTSNPEEGGLRLRHKAK